MIVNTKETAEGLLVIVVDDEILGNKYEEGNKQLDLSASFYQGKEMPPNEIQDLLRNADHIHLVGKNSVELGVKEDLVDEEHIITVDGIPHAEVTRG